MRITTMMTPNPNIQFPLLVSAATNEQLADPAFSQVITNWKQMAKRIVLVVPNNAAKLEWPKVRYVKAPANSIMFADVMNALIEGTDGISGHAVMCDPRVVMRFGVLDVFKIAADRQIGSAWMATGLARVLKDYMEAGDLEPEGLRWFCTSVNVWAYVARSAPKGLPFKSPLWGGSLASWASVSLHAHKYHDITKINALGVMPMAESTPTTEETVFWSEKATFNPPAKSFFR